MDLSGIFYFIVSMSLMGSILAIGILIIKRLLRQKLSANWQYYIWFVLLVRLMIPFTPAVPFNLLNFIPHFQQAVNKVQMSQPSFQQTSSSTSVIPPDKSNANAATGSINDNESLQQSSAPATIGWFNWQKSALVWLMGVSAIFTYILIINGLLLWKIKKLPQCDSDNVSRILQECINKLNVRSDVAVVYDPAVKSPVVFGLFHPKIIISPKVVKELTDEELSYVFSHELSHLKRGDLIVNGLVLAMQVIYWFNPLIWLALHQMKQDCEIACDATVLASLKPEDHKKYGQTIINLLQLLSETHWIPGTLGFAGKFNSRRIIMISKFRKTTLKWTVAAVALTLVVGCSSLNNPMNPGNNSQSSITPTTSSQQNTKDNTSPSTDSSSATNSNSVIYKNTQYGFSFTLPQDWKGYSIVNSQWQGLAVSDDKVVETGPIISIRDPRWTSKTPRQDIPIMIFTLGQWNSLQQDVFHIGAAPIGPSELGRNNSYVFALPARYNYAFPEGYQEVETILKGSPLQTTQTSQQHPDATESLLSNMMISGAQGKVLYCDFPAKITTIDEIEKVWGKADKTDYVANAGGRYATYSSHNVVFGINKGEQIYEVRSYDSRLKGITLQKAKEVLGAPAYDAKTNGQEIIGYTTNSEFKVEMVFPQPTGSNPNPVIDHYNVLYPQGTVNSMADYPGRQW